MAAPRQVIEISISEADFIELEAIARSRTEWACRVERTRILLACRAHLSTYAVDRLIGVTHQTVQRCVSRAVQLGVMAALDDSPRPGQEPKITDDAKAWVVSLAYPKAKELGYPNELLTTRLLARHVRKHAEVAGYPFLMRLSQEPESHPGLTRDHEYKRHGTLSLLAGMDLLTSKAHSSIENRHRSREFVGFLEKLDAAYPTDTVIKLILDNHSAHTSEETKAWLATQQKGCFTFVFTPKHGSWLNVVLLQ